jgi:hypothetical protein
MYNALTITQKSDPNPEVEAKALLHPVLPVNRCVYITMSRYVPGDAGGKMSEAMESSVL